MREDTGEETTADRWEMLFAVIVALELDVDSEDSTRLGKIEAELRDIAMKYGYEEE